MSGFKQERFKEIRVVRKMNLPQLAAKPGLTEQAVSKYELDEIEFTTSEGKNKKFNEDFFKNLFDEPEIKKLISWKPEGESNIDLKNHKNWKTGTICFPLVY